MDSRIDVNDIENLRYWCAKLEASEEELRRAVDQVGPKVEDVRQHLFGGFTTAGPTS
jgi:hypothetical protein